MEEAKTYLGKVLPPPLQRRKSLSHAHHPHPPLGRQTSIPTTVDEKRAFDFCLEGGEDVRFLMCVAPVSFLAPLGFHMGIEVTRDNGKVPKTFTLGFYPKDRSTTAVIQSFLLPVEGAIFIPDPQLKMALEGGGATEIYQAKLSATSAHALNNYTCNGIETVVTWPNDPTEGGFGEAVTMFLPKKLQYKFIYGNESCINCRGFISTIFNEDPEVIKAISSSLWGLESPIVADNIARSRPQPPPYEPSMVGDPLEFPGLMIGGRKVRRKKSHKTKRRKSKRKRRHKTRKKRKKSKRHKNKRSGHPHSLRSIRANSR